MEDISLQIRRNKRGNDPKLCLSFRLISIIPQQEILDLSNNKITSLDSQFQNFKNLKMLDLSNNNITKLEQFINQMNLQILNLSSNPLEEKFKPLSLTQNQQQPKLKQILEECFQSQVGGGWIKQQSDPFSDINFSQSQTKKSDPFSDINFSQPQTNRSQPNWFDTPMNQTANNKKETIDGLLKLEQQKTIELQAQLEQMKLQKNNSQEYNNQNDNQFQHMDIDYDEIEIQKTVSQGGFSIVYKGEFRGTQVAIKKIFDPNITSDLLDEFNNELNTLSKLRHPNIVLMMGVVTKPPNLCIVTEYLQNGSLFDILHKGKKEIQFNDKLKIAIQSAKAFNYLHLSKIVHRDIKSHNVLLDDNMKIKICDFGLAKTYNELNKGTRQFCGTPCYMAPELFQKRAYNHKIDIFAYGTLLWEIFQREVPYEGQEPQDIMKKVMANQQLQLFEVGINQIVQSCRQQNPDDRPDFKDIIQKLENL